MSYRKKHIKHKIQRIKPRKIILLQWWFWIIILMAVLAGASVYFALFYPGIQVDNVVISGNSKISNQQLQDLILSGANTGLLKFWSINISSRSILLVDTNKIDQEILQKFPIINKVSLNKDFPNTLMLGVAERIPVGIYCPGSSYSQADGDCFLIDNNGVIFSPLTIPSANYFIVRQVAGDANVYTGENVINQNVIEAIMKIQKDLQTNFKINVTQAIVASSMRVNLQTDQGWQIYVNVQGSPDIDAQITKLNLLLNGDINDTARKTLQYIDLRFEDRAYYK